MKIIKKVDQVDFINFRTKYREFLITNFEEKNILPFWGNQNATIVHIGQAPSKSGVKNQKPFSDKTGEKLRRWYGLTEEEFYDKDKFYLTALGLYFPGKQKGGGDKTPSMHFAKEWLTKEISFLNPKLFVILGRLAATFFFGNEKFEKLVFEDQRINGVKTLVIPHASPLNIKWFKDHPDFLTKRLPYVRDTIQDVSNSKKTIY